MVINKMKKYSIKRNENAQTRYVISFPQLPNVLKPLKALR